MNAKLELVERADGEPEIALEDIPRVVHTELMQIDGVEGRAHYWAIDGQAVPDVVDLFEEKEKPLENNL